MKVKVLTKFKDKYTGETYKVDDEITISKERFEEILIVGHFVEPVEEVVKPAKPKARKKTSK